jgi:phospholipid/cholesterol/gamma-HCH transport system substrate-binding protein
MLMAGTYVWLQGSALFRPKTPYTAEFDNAQGIVPGTVVRLSGVKVGEVKKVEVSPTTRRALVRMEIDQDKQVGLDDEFTIATGGLLPAPYIEIVPRREPGQRTPGAIQGVEPTNIDRLFREAEGLLQSMNQLTRSLETYVNDEKFTRNVKSAAASIAATTERGERIAANLEELSRRGPALMANLERATRAAEGTASEAQATVAENRQRVARLMDQSSKALEEISQTLVEARTLIADEQTREDLRGTLSNVRAASGTLRETAETLRQTASDVQSLTGDPKLQEDLRETVSGARETMEQAVELLQRLNRTVGSGGERAAGTRQRLRDTDIRLDLQQATSPGRARLDVSATIPGRTGGFTSLGLYDFGEDTRLNVQLGRPLRDNAWVRYGLYGSRIGVGLDWGRRSRGVVRPWFSADLYGLDEPRMDLRAATSLSEDLELMLGLDRLFDDNAPVIGVRWHP